MASKAVIVSLSVLLLVLMIWVLFIKTGPVVTGEGRVVSAQKLQVIEHLEGGMIDELFVKEGQQVEDGQELIKIDDTHFSAEYQQQSVKLAAMQLDEIRLQALINGDQALVIPKWLQQQYPELAQQAQVLFMASNEDYAAKIAKLKDDLVYAKKELALTQDELSKLKIEHHINQTQHDLTWLKESREHHWLIKLVQTRIDKKILEESLLASENRLARTSVRSPVSGLVNQIYVTTEGEVIDPGTKIMDIIPHEEGKQVIEAYLPADNVGYLAVGNRARIRFSESAKATDKLLIATITNISPDTILQKGQQNYYEVTLLLEHKVPLPVGTPVTVYFQK